MTKNKKAIAAVLLGATLLSATLSGCVTRDDLSSKDSDTTTVTTAVGDAAPALSGKLVLWSGDTMVTYFTALAEKFTAKTGVEVEIIPFTGLSAADKLALDGPAGKGGDVYMQGGGGEFAVAVEQGLFMDIPEDKFDKSIYVEGGIDNFLYKGKYYGVPMGIETPALMYNKKLIDSIPEDWEEFIEKARGLTDVKGDKYGFLMDYTNPYFTQALFSTEGGYIFKMNDGVYDTNDIGFNSTGTKNVFKKLTGYIDDGLFPSNMPFDVMQAKFVEGKVAVIYDGPWAVENYRSTGIDLGIAPLPKMSGVAPVTFSGAYGLSISSFSKNKDAAVAFLNFATEYDNIIDYYASTKKVPAVKACLEDEAIKNDPIASGFAAQLENSYPQPNIPEMGAIWGPAIECAVAITTQDADFDKTFDQTVEKIKEAIAIIGK